ncbi:unnamed protein product [Bursaphelenchus xylophilus]|uniref:(pine wood nematode) hypothetical protein n=1 Tax=Bursaphelenchus xylophilus TaxID=6326 RepID=A0A1I7SUP7_BURXY|nr:unnamed protein product [Bursaphelenchus xylophilus]CAG9125971.1 unnamed protein product [Bursaphelenchus xylophilus]
MKKEPLWCYNGDAVDLELLDLKNCSSQYCVKIVDKDNFYQLRSCDSSNLCVDLGNKCAEKFDRFPWRSTSETLCCCKSDKCNGSYKMHNNFIFGLIMVFIINIL